MTPQAINLVEKLSKFTQQWSPRVVAEMNDYQFKLVVAYGPDRVQMVRRAASFTDRIIKGAKPADLPFEQAATFELILNRKTAKALGLSIPPQFLMRVDRVIE